MWWLLFGCPSPTSDTAESGSEACHGGDTVVEIGETESHDDGSQTWAEMPEGSEVTMIHGPQGGWHILASAKVWNTDDIVTILYSITVDTSGATISDNSYRVQLVNDTDCSGYYPGMYGYLDVSGIAEGEADTPPELLGGAALTIHMEASDTEGHTATDDRAVVARLDPADEE